MRQKSFFSSSFRESHGRTVSSTGHGWPFGPFRSAYGLIGDSFLSYDAITKRWQQTWVTNFGAYMFLTGTFKDGVLTLEGNSHTKTRDIPHRITWKAEYDRALLAAGPPGDGPETSAIRDAA